MQGSAGRATLLPATSLLLKTATNLARLSLPHYDSSLGEVAQGMVSAHAHIPHIRKCWCLMRDRPYPSVRAVSRRIQLIEVDWGQLFCHTNRITSENVLDEPRIFARREEHDSLP